MTYDAATAVANGVAFLDARVPGWHNRIDLKTFDITDGRRCVLGQVYGDFTLASIHLGMWHGPTAMNHGFDVPNRMDVHEKFEVQRQLREEWTRVLTILQQEQKPTVIRKLKEMLW